jgi:hypothetical protein
MTTVAEASLFNLLAAGFVKAPLEMERTYNGVRVSASIQPSRTVLFGGETCVTLSARRWRHPEVSAGHTSNGWTFRQFGP